MKQLIKVSIWPKITNIDVFWILIIRFIHFEFLFQPNVRFQKRARWGIGLVTRREGLYRSENKQLKTFCWLHVFLWMIITCLQRCSQHLLQWSYATPGLLYMILFAPYLPLQLTLLRKRFFSHNFLNLFLVVSFDSQQ